MGEKKTPLVTTTTTLVRVRRWRQKPQPRPGWDPDPPMVGIRSPIGLVVGSCTSHPGVWVRFPNERNQGKQAHPVLKYRVPHGSQHEQLCNRSCSNKTRTWIVGDRGITALQYRGTGTVVRH